jgi:uncharacterized ubiquitin-like protein YukD
MDKDQQQRSWIRVSNKGHRSGSAIKVMDKDQQPATKIMDKDQQQRSWIRLSNKGHG